MNERILIIEDDQAILKLLQRGLAYEGYTVDTALDGRMGLIAARDHTPDLVVLDWMLPGMSGYTVVRTLREEGHWVPVLMLSAKDGEYDMADGLDYGADDYLTKPFSFVVLLARLRALVRRDPLPRPTILRAGDLELDPAARAVTADGVPAALAPREFALLHELMRAHPAVVSKEALVDAVWGDGAPAGEANLVEVYIGHLRRKLGRERIETVRGAGYRVHG